MMAFAVYGDVLGEPCREIVFSRRAVWAQKRGAAALGIDFYEVESCEREPELDRYSPGPVPIKTLINDHGWVFLCFSCSSMIDEYTDKSPCYPTASSVYCSSWCWLNCIAATPRILAVLSAQRIARIGEESDEISIIESDQGPRRLFVESIMAGKHV